MGNRKGTLRAKVQVAVVIGLLESFKRRMVEENSLPVPTPFTPCTVRTLGRVGAC